MEYDVVNMLDQTNHANQRIHSFDALKGIAFLGIFLLHTKCPVEWAAFGVSFFIMSGYLLELRHGHEKIRGGLKIKYVLSKKTYSENSSSAFYYDAGRTDFSGISFRNMHMDNK